MLQTLGGLKSSRNMLVDEQVAMFLHIISHHLKNRVIKHYFNRSGETVSRSFHNVLNAIIRLQDVLFKKAEPITVNSTDLKWKWFKNCLGALDGTHIKIKVPTVDKPRYRMRKVMSGFSQSSVSSQSSRGTKRKWVPEEDAALVAYMSHKEAAQFRHRSFPYYDQLTAIYAKDRATGKDAQTAADIIEEINAEDVVATNTHEERDNFHGSEADVSLDDMDLSATQLQPARNQGVLPPKCLFNKSKTTIQESALKLYPTLCEVEGLTEDERYQALSKIPDHPTQMLFFLVYLLLYDWNGSEDFLLTIKNHGCVDSLQ
ncbi:hypothetical protein J1N35_011313 [Gossypium stocksii]|uniref:DUF8040 domain-containing protein n=1 Tax=Gossypium stocksii TaxID=47602 RepID=A0A9D3W478_9ROSI|nr:hypothetical protein J1N35_011313 [Gossypium stocksii]